MDLTQLIIDDLARDGPKFAPDLILSVRNCSGGEFRRLEVVQRVVDMVREERILFDVAFDGQLRLPA